MRCGAGAGREQETADIESRADGVIVCAVAAMATSHSSHMAKKSNGNIFGLQKGEIGVALRVYPLDDMNRKMIGLHGRQMRDFYWALADVDQKLYLGLGPDHWNLKKEIAKREIKLRGWSPPTISTGRLDELRKQLGPGYSVKGAEKEIEEKRGELLAQVAAGPCLGAEDKMFVREAHEKRYREWKKTGLPFAGRLKVNLEQLSSKARISTRAGVTLGDFMAGKTHSLKLQKVTDWEIEQVEGRLNRSLEIPVLVEARLGEVLGGVAPRMIVDLKKFYERPLDDQLELKGAELLRMVGQGNQFVLLLKLSRVDPLGFLDEDYDPNGRDLNDGFGDGAFGVDDRPNLVGAVESSQ